MRTTYTQQPPASYISSMEVEEEAAALWRILNRKGGGAAAFEHVEEKDGSDFIEYHLYLDSVARSSDPGQDWADGRRT